MDNLTRRYLKVGLLFGFDYGECLPKWCPLEGAVGDLFVALNHCEKISCDVVIIITDASEKTLSVASYGLIASGQLSSKISGFVQAINHRGVIPYESLKKLIVVTYDEKGIWTRDDSVRGVLQETSMLFIYYSGHGENNMLIIPSFRLRGPCFDQYHPIIHVSPNRLIDVIVWTIPSFTPIVIVFDSCECEGISAPFTLTLTEKRDGEEVVANQVSRICDYDIYDGRLMWSISSTTRGERAHTSSTGSSFTNYWFSTVSSSHWFPQQGDDLLERIRPSIRVSHPTSRRLPLWFVSENRSDIRVIFDRVVITRYENTPSVFYLH